MSKTYWTFATLGMIASVALFGSITYAGLAGKAGNLGADISAAFVGLVLIWFSAWCFGFTDELDAYARRLRYRWHLRRCED